MNELYENDTSRIKKRRVVRSLVKSFVFIKVNRANVVAWNRFAEPGLMSA